MAATAEKTTEVSMLEKLNQLSDDIHGYNSENQEQHRLQYNAATQELFDIMGADRDGEHLLSEEEREIGQEAFDRVKEIKPTMKSLNAKAKRALVGPVPTVGEEVPESLQRGFTKAELLISKMGASSYRQKLARNAIFDAGCIKKAGQVVIVVPVEHPAKKALWDAYFAEALRADKVAVIELQEKQENGSIIDQEVRRLEVLINKIIPELEAKVG